MSKFTDELRNRILSVWSAAAAHDEMIADQKSAEWEDECMKYANEGRAYADIRIDRYHIDAFVIWAGRHRLRVTPRLPSETGVIMSVALMHQDCETKTEKPTKGKLE